MCSQAILAVPYCECGLLKNMLANRLNGIKAFLAMEVLERAKQLEAQGRHIIHFELGEPDFDSPVCAREAADYAISQGHTHYTHSLGDVELREELANYYKKRYNLTIAPNRFLITSGSSPGMTAFFSALLNHGDKVIMSNPCYACYPNMVKFFGGEVENVLVREDEGFLYRPEDIKKSLDEKVKAIIINSPANPTGTILDAGRLKAIAALDTLVVSDEIYHGLSYGDAPEHCYLEFSEKAVIVSGFSKAFAMTGWRVGYLILPEEFVRPMQIISQNFFICVNAAAQKAALCALRNAQDEVVSMREVYDRRRKLMFEGLNSLGLTVKVEPTGAFYMLANCRHLSSDSYKLAFDILEKAGIGVTPGIDFGSGAEGFIRFSYANSEENIEEGLSRLKKYLEDFS